MKRRVRYLADNIVELVTCRKFGKGYYVYIQSTAKRPQISHYGGDDVDENNKRTWSSFGIADADDNNICEISFEGDWDIVADHQKWGVNVVLLPSEFMFEHTKRIKPHCRRIKLPKL